MKTKKIILWIVGVLVFQLSSEQILFPKNHLGEIAVIVHISNPDSNMAKEDVKVYFLRKHRNRWKNGEKIRPVDHIGNPQERKEFLSQVLDMSAEEVERYWIEQQYVKAESPPRRVQEDSQILKFVETFAGAISFINRKSLTKESLEKVKEVLILKYGEKSRAE